MNRNAPGEWSGPDPNSGRGPRRDVDGRRSTGAGDCSGADVRDLLGAETVLDALAAWDECFRRGEDPPPGSFGVSDPALLEELCGRIERQKRLYAVLELAETTADGAAGAETTLPSFPGHETLGKIGQGGMGVVYTARDQKLGRVVAIKTIAAAQHATRAQLDRFRAEAEAVARLKHANVIPIYTIGEHEGRPYYSLEYAEGGSLAQRLAQGPMPAAGAALLIETLAGAVHAAHLAGIVHRDLKPSNVLLTAEGAPKVSDFGVAKLLDSGSKRTLSGEALGTPSYMAPEQADGHSKSVGPAADVYALGAILYQALTGKPPFLGESAIETLKLVVSTEVLHPRRLRPDVPRDLETICLKCLEKSPGQRYATAFELAGDLGRFQRGEPVRARRLGPARRLSKWARRHPWQTTSGATVLAAVLALIGLTYRHNVQLRAEVGRTRAKAAEARRNYQEARSTIQAMLDRLQDRRLAGSPRLLDLRRDQREDALAFYDRILRQVDSNDPVVRADTARALTEASAVQHELGHDGLAEKSIRRALRLIEGLRSERPDDLEYMGLQIHCLLKLGGYLGTSSPSDEAVVVNRQAIELAERLVGATPDDLTNQELLAACHNTCAFALRHDRSALARLHYEKAIEIRERIEPSKLLGVSNRLAQTLVNLGVIDWQAKDHARAEQRFRRAEGLLLSAAPDAREPGEHIDVDIGQVNVNWGGMLHTLGRYDEAIARADAGLARLEPYLRIEPNDWEAREMCLKLHGNRGLALALAGRHRESAREWTRVVELAREPVPPEYRIRLAIELLQAGEMAGAKTQTQLLKPAPEISAADGYNVACLMALSAAATAKDTRTAPDERARLVESDIRVAIRWLQCAASSGFFKEPGNRDHARKDPDLAILAGRAEFRKLLESSAAEP